MLFLEQLSETGNLESKLILRQNKLDLMAMFTQVNSLNLKIRQDRIANELGCTSSTLKRYSYMHYAFIL